MHRFTLTMSVLLAASVAGCGSSAKSDSEVIGFGDYEGPYRHVVAFRFKEGVTQEEIDAINAAFAELPDKIDTIVHFEFGRNVSPEGLNEGFTYCYLVTFRDKAGLEHYLPHPAHKAFVDMLKPKLDKPFVIDYVPEKMR